ncbi:MAG: hypothetical protein KAT46_02845 [Deltaproteobacteria bacterium]|nr:hypothetical protein [Deltaproteobacteria bacterium]
MKNESITQEIIDTFIAEISKNTSIGNELGKQIREALNSTEFNKDKLREILEKGDIREDS